MASRNNTAALLSILLKDHLKAGVSYNNFTQQQHDCCPRTRDTEVTGHSRICRIDE